MPYMSPEYCNSVTDRYIELYEQVTGKKFEKAESEDVLARIEKNVSEYLASRK